MENGGAVFVELFRRVVTGDSVGANGIMGPLWLGFVSRSADESFAAVLALSGNSLMDSMIPSIP